jgi:hypothetical protein
VAVKQLKKDRDLLHLNLKTAKLIIAEKDEEIQALSL